jgi:hypothetical protein
MKKDPDQNSTDSAEIEALITRIEPATSRWRRAVAGSTATLAASFDHIASAFLPHRWRYPFGALA